jgi:hypothetical protein
MMSTIATPPPIASLLQSRQEVADGTMAFRFVKPQGWAFKAGQFLDMTLLNPAETDAEGNTRTFSIASGPDEDTRMVATRQANPRYTLIPTMSEMAASHRPWTGETGLIDLHAEEFSGY